METEQKVRENIVKKTKMEDNLIYIGQKPLLVYISTMQKMLENHDIVKIEALGKNISKAVDLATNKFTSQFIKINSVKVDSLEKVNSRDNKVYRTSKIMIEISRR